MRGQEWVKAAIEFSFCRLDADSCISETHQQCNQCGFGLTFLCLRFVGDDWACAAENHLPENNVKIFRRIPEGQPPLLSRTFPLKRAHSPLSLFHGHKRTRFTCLTCRLSTAPPLLLINCCCVLRLIVLSFVC